MYLSECDIMLYNVLKVRLYRKLYFTYNKSVKFRYYYYQKGWKYIKCRQNNFKWPWSTV